MKHIGKSVNIDGKIGKIIDQNENFVLIHFEHGSKIVFNVYRIRPKEWI